MRKLLVLSTAAMLVGAFCAAPAFADGDGAVIGTLGGAAVGGLIGNQFGHGAGRDAATAAGVIFGGLIGNNIGSSIDNENRYYSSTPAYAYSYPEPVYYQTTYVPNYVAPSDPEPSAVAYYDNSVGSYCREFTQEVRIDGQMQESYGTACLQPDGSWRVVP